MEKPLKTVFVAVCKNGIAVAALLFFALFSEMASATGDEGHEKEPFKAADMIIHHIQDAHQIHLFGHTTIPLPVILYTDKGIDLFSSSNFWDEHHEPNKAYYSAKTNYTYINHHEKIEILGEGDLAGTYSPHSESGTPHVQETIQQLTDSMNTSALLSTLAEQHGTPPAEHSGAEEIAEHKSGHSVLDLSITKSVFGMLFMLAVVILIFTRVAKAYSRRKGQAPKGLQNLMEPLVLFIKDEVAIPAIGKKKAMRYLPFLLTMFFFTWVCNLFGLIPFLGGFNITGTLSITLVMAAMVFFITSFSGNKHYWGHIFWPPGVPLAIKVILVPIEIASVFIKPCVLMIRLTANINAGHIVILALTSLIFIFGQQSAAMGYGVGVAASLFMVFMFFIELLVTFLQAYVFTLLAALYFGDATQEHHHEEH